MFIVFLLSHLIGDFIFQTDQMAKYKGIKFQRHTLKKKLFSLFLHIFVHFFILIITLFLVSQLQNNYITSSQKELLIVVFLVIITHAMIDCFKFLLTKYLSPFSIFLCDQLLHIITIYSILFCFIADKNGIENILYFLDLDAYSNFNLSYLDKFILVIILNLIGIFFASYFIDLYLKQRSINPTTIDQKINFTEETNFSNVNNTLIVEESSHTYKRDLFIHFRNNSSFSFGRIIGVVERFLIILLVSTNNYATIAIIIALKTLTRFKLIEQDKDFGEYYLMGNLLSLLFSIVIGTLIKMIILL